MAQFRLTEISSFLILLLHLTAATVSFTARDGSEVTLHCGVFIPDQDECNGTDWLFSGLKENVTEELAARGKIVANEAAPTKAARLSVTANCSLVIKNVSADDVGRYVCQQHQTKHTNTSDQKPTSDAEVHLSVVKMTERKETNKQRLGCSVLTYGQCRQTATWLYGSKRLDKPTSNISTILSPCKITVSYVSSEWDKEKFKCEVLDRSGEVGMFDFSPLFLDDTETANTTSAEPPTIVLPDIKRLFEDLYEKFFKLWWT